MSSGDRGSAPNGVILEGPWTWQGRLIEDVLSPMLMEPDSIANLLARQTDQAAWRADQRERLSQEMARTGEHFTAALKVIRERQRAASEDSV